MPVHTVGKIGQVFNGVGVDEQHKGSTNAAAIDATARLIDSLDGGFVFANLVETDQVFGHRNDVEGFHGALREIDAAVGDWLGRLDPERDLLVLTADHGCDPTHPGTDHTREHAPLLAALLRPRGPAPRRPVRRRRRLRPALADRPRRRGPARRAVRAVTAGAAAGGRRAALAVAVSRRAGLALAGCGGGDPPRAQPTADARHSGRAARADRRGADRRSCCATGRRRSRRASAVPTRPRRPARQRRRDRVVAAPGGAAAAARRRARRRSPRRPRPDRDRDGQDRATASAACAGGSSRAAGSAPCGPRTAGASPASAIAAGMPPWEVGAFVRRRSPHFVVLAPSVGRRRRPAQRRSRTGTRRSATACATCGCAGATSCVVAADADQARALTTGIRGVEALAALADATVIQEGPAQRTERVDGAAAGRGLDRLRAARRRRPHPHRRPRAHARRARGVDAPAARPPG